MAWRPQYFAPIPKGSRNICCVGLRRGMKRFPGGGGHSWPSFAAYRALLPSSEAMTMILTGKPTILTGWGRTDPSTAQLCLPAAIEQIQSVVASVSPASLIARGLGRAYGNPAQCADGTVLDLTGLDQIQLDAASGSVTCGAGASLNAVLHVIVPAGFFLPVTPGTRNVTVGGAIASDVHGKNHHGEGSFANHVNWLKLVDGSGELRLLSPSDPATAEAFWATAGGMGLTGVIVEAYFRPFHQQFADQCGHHPLSRARCSDGGDVDPMPAAATAWPGWIVLTGWSGCAHLWRSRRI